MAGQNSRKITKYPKNINNLNIGVVFFVAVAIYIIISVVIYLGKDRVIPYQVMDGSLSTNNIYEAIAIRSEKIVPADRAGYVYYIASEGTRAAVGDLVYTIDESGKLIEYLKSQGSEEVELNDESMSELRSQIMSFTSSFDEKNFYTVYDFKSGLDGTVQKLSNSSLLNDIQSLNLNNSIARVSAQDPGIVIYSTDGYENLTPDSITLENFDQSKYEKHQLINNSLVKKGDPVYKICDSEDWSIIINVKDEEQAKELESHQYVDVKFIKNQDISSAKVSSFTNGNGDKFFMLSFTNSMITFCRDRFLSVEILTDSNNGLKIPNSAIVEKSFFTIPHDFISENNDDTTSVLRDKYDEQGNKTVESVNISIYNEDDSDCYIDTDSLRAGDVLIKPDSTATFTVGKTGTLKGVYNYNKGYADFKQIEVLYNNEEYSIVKSKTRYGLRVYDYIILDAESYDKNLRFKDEPQDSQDSEETSASQGSADEAESASSGDSQNSEDSQATIDESADGGSTANP